MVIFTDFCCCCSRCCCCCVVGVNSEGRGVCPHTPTQRFTIAHEEFLLIRCNAPLNTIHYSNEHQRHKLIHSQRFTIDCIYFSAALTGPVAFTFKQFNMHALQIEIFRGDVVVVVNLDVFSSSFFSS